MKSSLFKVILLISIILIFITISGLEGGIKESKSTLIRKFDETNIYSSTEEILNEGIGNDKGGIAWGVADNIISLIDMFESTGKRQYLDKAYDYIDRIKQLRDDNRGVVSYLNSDSIPVIKPIWRNLIYSKYYIGELPKDSHLWEDDNLFIRRYDKDGNVQYPDISDAHWASVHMVNTGNILRCLLRFAEILDKYELWDDYPFTRAGYLNDIKSSFEVYNTQWFEFSSDIGGFDKDYFNYGWRDNDKLSDNSEKVFERLQYHPRGEKNYPVLNNYFTSMGSSLLMMYELTEDSGYLIKVQKLINSFKMGLDETNNAYHWNYKFSKLDSDREEDVSHARLSTHFLYKCFHSEKANLDSINYEDMEKLANMFMRNMFKGDIDHYEWVFVSDTFIIDTTDTIYTNDDMIIVTDTTDTSMYCWELIMKDGIYDISGFVDGTSADSAESHNIGYWCYTGWAKSSAIFYVPLCKYDPRIYEAAYNICSDWNYKGLKNLLYYYDDYKPCTVTSNPDSITCNKTEDVEIVFNNIKILGDLSVKIIHDGEVLKEFTFTDPFSKDTVWTAGHILDDFRTDKTKPLIIEYYSDNDGIKGPLRSHEIPIKGKKLYVEHMDEIPVLKYTNIDFSVKGMDVNWNDTLKYPPVAVPGCTIDIEYADGSINRGITDENGEWVFWNEEIDNTKPLSITVYKTGCLTYRSTIVPYMWSHSNKATGPNNSNSIIRDGDSLFMVYSLYDPYAPGSPLQQRRVIGAVSDNDGKWWQVYDLGYGRNACLDKLESLPQPDIFLDELNGYEYSGGGYTDPTTVTNGSAWVEPGSMWSDDVDTSYLQAAGISYLYATSPALIHMQIPRGDVENTIVDTLIDKDGELTKEGYLTIPAHNPSIALAYNTNSEDNDIIIAFEDKNSEICQIRYFSDRPEWNPPVRKSNSLSLKSTNPHADAYGDKESVVWQEEISPNSDNYRIYLNDDRFFMDTSETNKEYPKIKRNSYISYVEEDNNIKMWYYSTEDTLEKDIFTGNNPIYYPDFDIKLTEIRPKTFRHDIYLMYTEADDEIYRIKTYHDHFTTDSSDAGQEYELIPSDTQIVVSDSPLYSYLPSSQRRPVERLSSTIKGLNSNKYYDVRIISTNHNKNEPYVFMLDNNETVVIYGKENDTIISVPSEYITDNALTLSLDRTKGNPNRTAEFKVYGYDEVAEAGASAANRIQFNGKSPVNNYQFKVTSRPVIKNSAIKMTVELPEETIVRVSIYDIMGREVKGMNKKLSMGINTLDIDTDTPLSGGVYFIKVTAGSNSYTDKLINLR